MVVQTVSLPEGVPSSFYRELLDRTSGRAVMDVRGPDSRWHSRRWPLVVKPNREELAKTFGHTLETEAELLAAMRR